MLTRLRPTHITSLLSLLSAGALLLLCSLAIFAFYPNGWTTLLRATVSEESPAGAKGEKSRREKRIANSTQTRSAPLSTTEKTNSASDTDRDGIPDAAELRSFTDRENFRRWFTAIAEMQFYRMSNEWTAEQRDCAGLVRFAWREALRAHDRQWFQKMGAGYEPLAPDVAAYTLENNLLNDKLFRTKSGAFRETDLANGNFAEFADARTLKEYNSRFVGRDRRRAEAGDLLFFFQPHAGKFPYHVMLLLGAAHTASEDANDWVVYHTGATAHDPGTVKKVRLGVLDEHPDRRWRPVENNRNFLGFYRLKILD